MGCRLVATLLICALCSADRLDEDCGYAARLRTACRIVSAKRATLESIKAAKDKRAKKATKPQTKRWIQQEFAAELAGAIEAQMDELAKDNIIIGSACHRNPMEQVADSALQGRFGTRFNSHRCSPQIEKRASSLLEEFEESLTQAIIQGSGAGTACSEVLSGCTAERATLLLGSAYRDDSMTNEELERVKGTIGMADKWTIHTDVDGSKYWFNKARMESQREPPQGWVQGTDGEWVQSEKDEL